MGKLLDTFYKEINTTFSAGNETKFSSTVKINAAHPIFHGHFKQVPITPGVCMIQMIKEILSEKLGKELFLQEGNNIKYLSMVNPTENPELSISFNVETNDKNLNCTATCSSGGTTCVKFKGIFRLV